MLKCLFRVITVFFLACYLSLGQAVAQDPTTSESIHSEQIWERYRVERQIRQATSPIPGVTITSPQPPVNIDEKSQQKVFKLNQILFDPNPTAIGISDIEAITEKYVAMEMVSIYDLYSMITEIDTLYDSKRILGRAVLPVQDIENGIVTIQIIEGRIEKTILETKMPCIFDSETPTSTYRWFGNYFIRKQFHFSGKGQFNLYQLENEILRYNRTFQSQLTAELEPGDELGSTTLKLTRILPKPVSGGYYVDNSGRESSGKIRNGAYLSLADIFGANESFFASYDETEGSSALYMSGELPVSSFGTFFDMSYYYGTPTTINGAWASLNINGVSEQYRPGIRQILVNTKNRRLDASLRYENYDSKTFFDTDLNFAEKHDSMTFGLENSFRTKKSAVFSGLFLVVGHSKTGTLAPNLSLDYSPHDFSLLKMNLMKIWYPTDKVTFIVRGNGNAALSWLPQSQVFQIGGQATVRGTPEALMSGDSGYLATLEGRYAVWNGSQSARKFIKNSKIELFTFLDHGGVVYREHSAPMRSADFLSSIGIGLMANLGNHISLMGGFGQPIFTAESHLDVYKDELKHGNAFFSARATF